MDNEMAQIPAKMAEEMAEQVRNEIAANPQTASMYNAAYGNAFGNIGTAPVGGLRLGKNPKTGNTYMAEFNERALAPAMTRARSLAPAPSPRQPRPAVASWARASTCSGSRPAASATRDMLYGVGAQFGGGGARGANAFIRAVQSGIGAAAST
jgi:hypothetical protein